ncbi:MAG: tetratricopeptide repeat protein [Magnetococcales bacterium]|nr:tetratricopeptide repeat protein [Magnetococcales bacterium]
MTSDTRSPSHAPSALEQLIQTATGHLQAGRTAEAQDCLEAILIQDPRHAGALANRGLLALQQGRPAEAIPFLTRAADLAPDWAGLLGHLGAALAQSGRHAEARPILERSLEIDPDQTQVAFHLGLVLLEENRAGAAIDPLQRALALDPRFFQASNNLGNALRAVGRSVEAVGAYRRALALRPDFAEAHLNLGLALLELKRFTEAEVVLRRVADHPTHGAAARTARARALLGLDRPAEAAESCRQALALDPDLYEARITLATLAHGRGEREAAVAHLRKAVTLRPQAFEGFNNLGVLLKELGRWEEAAVALQQAVALQPEAAEAHNNLGVVLAKLGLWPRVITHCARALELRPGFAEAHVNLATALQETGRLPEAVAHYHQALDRQPRRVEILDNLGLALLKMGDPQGALEVHRRAVELEPDFENVRYLINTLLYHPDLDPAEGFRLRCAAMARCTAGLDAVRPPPPPSGERLRIGYLSSDFRDHPVGHNITPLLTHHDRRRFEIFCYAEETRPDAHTATLRSLADHWVVSNGLDDAALARRIREDGIGVMVYLAGHYDLNRLAVAAHRPAPVQVTFHDVASSGLAAMDYWLTDAVLHPPDRREPATETLWRLPAFYVFPQPVAAPDPGPPPLLRRGAVTFGAFCNPAKLNQRVVALWSQILLDLPGSHLILKYRRLLEESPLTAQLRERFTGHGVAGERIVCLGFDAAPGEHLARHREVDIALDPFPHNGPTTTFQALWMGVPVVTLGGETFVGRMGAAVVTQAGHPEWVAQDAATYRQCVLELAGNVHRLAELRRNLRGAVIRSTLCDGLAHARAVEAAYLGMMVRRNEA